MISRLNQLSTTRLKWYLVVSASLFATSAFGQSRSCDDQHARLQAEISKVQSGAQSSGICENARAQARILRQGATFNRQCGGTDGQAQAAEFERAAAQADRTAASACK